MEITKQLKDYGLSASEIKVYIFLLSAGSSNIQTVARETNIARTNCYHLLKSLAEQYLIEIEYSENNKRFYRATDPEMILKQWDQKRGKFSDLLPALKKLTIQAELDTSTESLVTRNEVRSVYLDFVKNPGVVMAGDVELLASSDMEIYRTIKNNAENGQIAICNLPAPLLAGLQNLVGFHFLIDTDRAALVRLTEPVAATVINNKIISILLKTLLMNNNIPVNVPREAITE